MKMRFSRILLTFVKVLFLVSSGRLSARVDNQTVECDVTLKDLSDLSEFVLTAKIDSLVARPNHSHYNGDTVATIDIKRLIRANDKSLFENVTKDSKVSVILSSSLFFNDFFVGRELARKIGSCSRKNSYTNVKVRDTKIFCGRFLRSEDVRVRRFDGRQSDVKLELLAVSIQLNLEVLEYFTFIEDTSYRPRTHIDEEPCERKYCEYGGICEVENGQAKCKCKTDCPIDENYVCGTDGVTYKNECNLRATACQNKLYVRVQSRGECRTNPCAAVDCKDNEECVIDKFGIATCQCVSDCESVLRPVCGTDGLTYDSMCHLKESSCRLKNNVTCASHGVCGDGAVCANHRCDYNGYCVPKKGRPVCECPVCTNDFDPVCGSDGVSYENLCKLQREECLRQRSIDVLYKELCNGCENRKCDYYGLCESGKEGEAKCVCPTICSKENSPVCGSDGKVYPNDCEMKKYSCNHQKMIVVSSMENCAACLNGSCYQNTTRCEFDTCPCPTNCDEDLSISKEPVCASDMRTYSSECDMQKYACEYKLKSLTVIFYGDCKESVNASPPLEPMKNFDLSESDTNLLNVPTPRIEVCQDIICDYEGTCETGADGKPHCACIFDCSRELEKPVCGSDLQIYPSVCHMKIKSCQKQNEIRIRPIELCQGMQVKPCNGKQPIVDPLTQLELDCGSGPYRRDCPLNTYCHHTSKFARCCPKDAGLYLKSCKDSWYGCCPDKKTPAQGPDNAGCPSLCNCNKLGSYSDACDPETNQCKCKPGVGGDKCDRCEPGFWGLPKITSGHPGCLPCGCSLFGSVRDDCEQMTGRCVCKPEIQGPKCTQCMDPNKQLGPNGCVSIDTSTPVPSSCDEVSCYFNATCEIHDGQAKCICHFTCPQDYHSQHQAVCGNDGQTYSSECQLKLYSCRYQKDIAVQALSSCTDDYISGTDGPRLGAWTSISQFTEAEDVMVPIAKSTRHVLSSSESKSISYFTPKMPSRTALVSHHGDVEYNEVNTGKLRDSYHVIGEPTSATMTALIGDLCTTNDDCLIENSHCIGGICVCRDAYAESTDRLSCSEGITLAVTQRGCATNPCHNGGQCRDRDGGHYECTCPTSHSGFHCEIVKENKQATWMKDAGIEVPAFSGQSYIELKPLKAYLKFSVEIEFKSYTDNGILLYNQQRADGAGDFISLALVNGYAEFRYNLGNGPAVLTSLQRLPLNTYHKIVAKRYQRDGILQVNNAESIAGQSEGTLKALDLNDNAYIGYVPINSNKIFENIGTSAGFVGCVRKLKIGRHTIRLKDRLDASVTKTQDLKECAELVECVNSTDTCTCLGGICETESNSCHSNPCQHASICEPLLQGGYTCNCLPGHRGDSCEIFEPSADDLYMPQFDGVNAYIKFPCLENVRRSFSIDIWFSATALNGVLLYNGQLHNRRGDFIAVNLVNGYVQFRYDLGSGLANITTHSKVRLGQWQSVKIHRFDRIGSIQLNNDSIVKGMSGPPLNELNLELPLYVGGVPTLSEVSRESGITGKFSGVIQRILLNGKTLHLMAGQVVNVVPYKNHLCASDQTCLNGGICVPYLANFLCKCTSSFSGIHCQNYSANAGSADQELGVQFGGNVFLLYVRDKHSSPDLYNSFTNRTMMSDWSIDGVGDEYESVDAIEDETLENYHVDDMYDDTMDDFDGFFSDERRNRRTVQYEFSLRTTHNSGLLLWSSKIRQGQRDYLAVALNDGRVEFSHNFGKEQQIFSVKSEEIVSDGNWHTVLIQHRKRITQIRVDSNNPVKLHTDQIQKMFLTNGKVFIGGVPTTPADFPEKYTIGFRGCLRRLVIDKETVSLAQLNYNTTIPVEFCEENDI